MTTSGRSGCLYWIQAIGRTSLASREKSVLQALLSWIDFDNGEAWPSVQSVADAATLSVRTVQFAYGTLEDEGVLTYVRKSRGGPRQTHHIKIHFNVLNDLSRAEDPSEPQAPCETSNDQPQTVFTATPKPALTNGAGDSGEPSIHLSRKQLRRSGENAEKSSAGTRWMDGPERNADVGVREALVDAGIRGANLDLLARASALTADIVYSEFRSVSADPGVRNCAAVLTKRLAQIAGVDLRSRPLVPQSTLNAAVAIEGMRRNLGGSAPWGGRA